MLTSYYVQENTAVFWDVPPCRQAVADVTDVPTASIFKTNYQNTVPHKAEDSSFHEQSHEGFKVSHIGL